MAFWFTSQQQVFQVEQIIPPEPRGVWRGMRGSGGARGASFNSPQ